MTRRYNAKNSLNNVVGLAPDWAGWIKTTRHQFVKLLIRENPPVGDYPPQGPSVIMFLPGRPNALREGYSINLTMMTEDELLAFKQFVSEITELALPVCQLRDKLAREDYEQGRDNYDRIYRSPPQVVTRAWARGIDGQGLLKRLAHDAEYVKANVVTDDSVSDDGNELAESGTNDGTAKDD